MHQRVHAVLFCVLAVVCTTAPLRSQGLAAGPMVGHVDMREARIWVQTKAPTNVFVRYREQGSTAQWKSTLTRTTSPEYGNTAILVADTVEPGRTYEYQVLVNNEPLAFSYPTTFKTQPIWNWRGDDLPSWTMAIGSCFYVNEPGFERFDKDGKERGYGSDYEILTALYKSKPDVMLWLGDNTYLREPDWNSRTGMLRRYSHTRALPELQPLLASTAHYAIWDDHDFGPNNSNRGWWGKDIALEMHKLFWANPTYGTHRMQGIMGSFDMLDVQVFMMDDRYYRSPERRKEGQPGILGMEQVQWLIDGLASSNATFKIIAIGSQFLTSDTTKESFSHHPMERQLILDAITRNNIKGVLFVSGDIHAAELSKLERPGTYPLYEFTSSSLTAGSNTGIANQTNEYRVAGTAYGQHNFGLLTVSGKRKNRVLTLRCMDKEGKEVWKRELKEEELR